MISFRLKNMVKNNPNSKIQKLAHDYFTSSIRTVAANSKTTHDFVEFYQTLGKLCDNLISNEHELLEAINNNNLNIKYGLSLNHELGSRKNPSNNFSVKINNHGVKKSLFSYATTSTEILQIIKRYVKPGDKVRLLSGTRIYNFKVLANKTFKKV